MALLAKKLTTPAPLTHENLASSNITNLPSLAHNPLMAAYLSDSATDAVGWTAGRRRLHQTLKAQGFSLDDFTHYPCPTDDIACALWTNLAQNVKVRHMVAHHLLAYHDVRPSETVPGRLAYYQDDKKRKASIRTPIKVRKYLQKFFGKFRTPEALEQIAETLDGLMRGTDEYDVRLFTDSQIDGWSAAYYHITSCMNTRYGDYGVGALDTYRCYCTAAMTDGKKSSDLTLAVLYQDDKPVARSIVYERDGQKYYVRNYGDDRLVRWLDDNGYVHQQWLPHGTHLWTEAYDDDNNGYLSPYVDGDPDDAEAELTRIGRRYYWVISSSGVVLQNCSGYTSATLLKCECCGDRIRSGNEDEYYRADLHGNNMTLCYSCVDNHCHTVNDEDDIYADPDMDNLIGTNSQGYYTQEYLDDNDLVVTGDEDVIRLAEAEYCLYSDEYYHESEFTDLSDEPEFVRDTWAGYITDSDRVHDWLLRRDGTYITELGCYVHDAHVSAVMARLESEADAE